MGATLDYAGRVVVVTGAGQGVGRAYATELAKRGAKIVVNDLGTALSGEGADQSIAERTAAEIRQAGGEAIASTESVATPEGGEAIIAAALQQWGRIDALIHNAGILRDASFPKLTVDNLDAVLAVNLRAAFFLGQPAFRAMKDAGHGRIVLTTSSSGLFGNFGQTNYSAAKMGVVGLTRALAIEGARYDIKVNALAPTAATRLTRGQDAVDLDDPLAPARLAPLVAVLCHTDCPSSGEIYQAGAGLFSRVKIAMTDGYHLPVEGTAEDLLAHWEEVRSGGDLHEFGSAKDLGAYMERRLGRPLFGNA